jgi:hypothetical protein
VSSLVEIVRVELKLGVPEDGLKLAVAPDGRPEADKLTVSLNPAIADTETVAVVDSPCTTDPEAGLMPMEKSGIGTAVTVRV